MNSQKTKLRDQLKSMRTEMAAMCDAIFMHPETGGEEWYAQALLTDYLKAHGFTVEMGVGGMPTSFRAVWECGSGGPTVGFLCEYDALRALGHGCGHHMQGPAAVAAAATLKMNSDGVPMRIVVYGTPDEEYGNGKVTMLQNGCFRDMDFALMSHAGPNTTVDIKSLAMRSAYVRFHGCAAHAAIKPEDGRSAVDAMLLAIHGFELLREHVRNDVRLHYAIRKTGESVNVVPDFAESEFAARSYSAEYLEHVWKRIEEIFCGAADMMETTVDQIPVSDCKNKIPVLRLNRLLMEHATELGAPQMIPYREQTGSTDFGNILHIMPGSCIRTAFVPEGTSSHSKKYIDEGKSEALHDAALLAAQVLALSAWDIFHDEELRKEIKTEFLHNLAAEKKEAES